MAEEPINKIDKDDPFYYEKILQGIGYGIQRVIPEDCGFIFMMVKYGKPFIVFAATSINQEETLTILEEWVKEKRLSSKEEIH